MITYSRNSVSVSYFISYFHLSSVRSIRTIVVSSWKCAVLDLVRGCHWHMKCFNVSALSSHALYLPYSVHQLSEVLSSAFLCGLIPPTQFNLLLLKRYRIFRLIVPILLQFSISLSIFIFPSIIQ